GRCRSSDTGCRSRSPVPWSTSRRATSSLGRSSSSTADATSRSTSGSMDRIFIRDLLVRCIIGVGPEERREKQDVLITVALSADLSTAGKSDRIEDGVNYRPLKKRILAVAEASEYHLIEALAERVAAECLENRDVHEVQVSVEKPSALRFARTVGVEIVRRR